MSDSKGPSTTASGDKPTGSSVLDSLEFDVEFADVFFNSVNRVLDERNWTQQQRCEWFLRRFAKDPSLAIFRYNPYLLANKWNHFVASFKGFQDRYYGKHRYLRGPLNGYNDRSAYNLVALIRSHQYELEKQANPYDLANNNQQTYFYNYQALAEGMKSCGKLSERELTVLMLYSYPEEIRQAVLGQPGVEDECSSYHSTVLLESLDRLSSSSYEEFKAIKSWYEQALSGSGFDYKLAFRAFSSELADIRATIDSTATDADNDDPNNADPVIFPETGQTYSQILKICIIFGMRWRNTANDSGEKSFKNLRSFHKCLTMVLEHPRTLQVTWTIPLLFGSLIAVLGDTLAYWFFTQDKLHGHWLRMIFHIIRDDILKTAEVQTSWTPEEFTRDEFLTVVSGLDPFFHCLYFKKPFIYSTNTSTNAGPGLPRLYSNPTYFYTEHALELYDLVTERCKDAKERSDFREQLDLLADALAEIVSQLKQPLRSSIGSYLLAQRPYRLMMTSYCNAVRMCLNTINKHKTKTMCDVALASCFVLAFFELFELPFVDLVKCYDEVIDSGFHAVMCEDFNIRDLLRPIILDSTDMLTELNPGAVALLWKHVYDSSKLLPEIVEKCCTRWEKRYFFQLEYLEHVFDKACFFATMDLQIADPLTNITTDVDTTYLGLDDGYIRDALLYTDPRVDEDENERKDTYDDLSLDAVELGRRGIAKVVGPEKSEPEKKCPFCNAVSHYEFWDCPIWLSYYPKERKEFYQRERRPVMDQPTFLWAMTEESDARDYLQFRRPEDGDFE